MNRARPVVQYYILDKCFSYLCVFQDTDPVADPAARWGTEKNEIYAAASGGHLFYDLFLQGWGSMAPRPPPGSATGPAS